MPWTRRDTAIATGLVLAPFVFFWPLFVPGAGRHYLDAGDFIDQFYAFASLQTRALAAGHLPLWNPYAYGGGPFWADIQSAVAYPISLAIRLAGVAFFGRLPVIALEIEAIAHLSLAGLFTYLFARRVLGSRAGALLAALAFGLGGYLTGYPPRQLAVLESNVWLPLALLGVEHLLRGGRQGGGEDADGDHVDDDMDGPVRRGSPVFLGVALGLGILAGHPQSALYLLYATLAYFVFRTWSGWPRLTPRSEVGRDAGRGVDLARSANVTERLLRRAAQVRANAVLLGIALLLALGLSAAGWLPAAQFLRLSNRATADYAQLGNGFPPSELLGFLLPHLTAWSPLYVGLLPLLLALVAGWRALGGGDDSTTLAAAMASSAMPGVADHREATGAEEVDESSVAADLPARRDRFWLGLALVALLLSLGRNGFLWDLFYLAAPGFNLFRGQERAAFLVSFSLAMLAGSGLAVWRVGAADVRRQLANGTVICAGLGLALAVAAPDDLRPAAFRLLFFAGCVALLVALGPAPGRRSRLAKSKWLGLMLIMVLVDLYAGNGRQPLVAGAPGELQVTPIIAALRNGSQRVVNEDRLPANFGVLHALESVGGASPLRLRSFDTLRKGLGEDRVNRFWDLLAVSHILTWQDRLDVPSEQLVKLGQGKDAQVLIQLEANAPYVWRALTAERVTSDAAAIGKLRDPAFNPFLTVLLHEGEGGEPGRKPGNEYSSADVGVGVREPGLVEASSTSDRAGWLVFSELDYPGWQATLDGRPAPVLRANVALMAVAVPAGNHTVRLEFTAPWVWAGIGISLASLLATVLLMWKGVRK